MKALLILACIAALSGCGMYGNPSGTTHADAMAAPAMARGDILVGAKGMTLYTFDRDVADSGKSVCNGQCAVNWPPLRAGMDARDSGDWKVIARDDGSKQWSYKGKPLYYWIKDQNPGDQTGDGFNAVWHVAKP